MLVIFLLLLPFLPLFLSPCLLVLGA